MRRRFVRTLAVAMCTVAAAAVPAYAATDGSSRLNWKVSPFISATITPNYQAGYGPQGGMGSGQTPAVGPLATLGGGFVDFGNVVDGYQYIYKYAAQVAVTTNDVLGFTVYAEGSSDFNGSNPTPTPATFPISTTLFWLPSAAANNPYTPGTPFEKTVGIPSGAPLGTSITYAGTPPASAIVWRHPATGTVSQGYDYQLRLTDAVPISQFDVYIVYTAVAN